MPWAGGVSAFSPANITGLVLWLKADALALTDGSAVATWTDSSGAGNTASQGTGPNQPIYKTNIANGMPVVRFDGSNDNLTIVDNGTLDLTGDQSIFVVVKYAGTIGALIAHYETGSPFNGWGFDIGVNGINKLGYWSSTKGSRLIDAGTISTTAFHVALVTRTSGTAQFYTDGTAGSNTTGTGNVAQNVTAIIGILPGGSASPLNGDIAEIIIYNVALSTANRNAVTAYLGTKYGITVV